MVFLALAILMPFSSVASTSKAVPLIKEQPHNIYHVIKNKTLLAATNQLATRTGITFKISADIKNDIINQKLAADDWKAGVTQMLHGYNYSTELDKGIIKTVVITGRNGSGTDNEAKTAVETDLVSVAPDSAKKLPWQYKNFNAGSVLKVSLPTKAELARIPVGEDLTLDLPIGQYKVKHDNLIDHGDGTSTWVGYLDDEGKGYRVLLSQGNADVMGNIYTPDGAYNIETVNGQTVIVDLARSGLKSAGYKNDDIEPTASNLMNAGAKTARAAKASVPPPKTGTPIANAAANTGPVVDLMVLYTDKAQTADFATRRSRYLVDVSNQAYKDSGINMSLRLVHIRQTPYVENNANSQALNDLATDRGAFSGTASLRDQYGADLVMLLRPLYAQSAGGCGTAYVGFANGGDSFSNSGYSVVGDGYSKDSLSNYYCRTSTFAHEIGHNLGNVHDREYSSFQGKFAYSYAWGIGGKFGTIMSYYDPSVLLFSTPNLATQCAGTPCGFAEGKANSSDQARTINFTAPIVANYKTSIAKVLTTQ
jgi:hypothetical protein